MKKIIMTVILLISVLTISSCSSNEKNDNPLTLYMMDGEQNIQNAVDKFNKTHNSNTIKVQTFYKDQKKELSDRLQCELASEDGPDIVLLEKDTLPELSKYIETGAFYDIDELMKTDKKINIKDYNSNVMDFGMYNGKRYAVPLFYSVSAFFTTDEILKSNNIDTSSIFLGMDKIAGAAIGYMKQNQGKQGTFFSPLDFSYFLDINKGFIDIEKKKANFNTGEFEKLLEAYKNLYEASDKDEAFDKYKEGGDSNLLQNGDTVMNLNEISCLKMIWSRYYSFTEEVTPDVRMISFNGREHATAVPVQLAAINSRCSNKKAAYEFIKLLLSEEYQENASTYSLPVNINAYETQKNIFLKGRGGNKYITDLRGGGIKSEATARKIISDIDKIAAAIDNCSLKDYKIYELIAEKLDEFLKGKISAEFAAKGIHDKVQTYLDSDLVKSQKSVVSATNEQQKTKLKLFYPSYFSFAENALRVFKKEYKNVEVELSDGTDNYKTRLATAVMSGDGPDVIIFQPYTFDSLHKVVNGGAFSRLDDIISSDKTFNLGDYNENVLKAGMLDGKRYYIPLSFNPQYLFTTVKALKNNAIQYDDKKWTWCELANNAKSFMQDKKNKEQYFFGYSVSLFKLMWNSEISFIDYKNKKTSFKSDEFIELLKAYKDLYTATVPAKISQQETQDLQYLKSCVLAEISYARLHDWNSICSVYSQIMKYKGEEIVVLPMPSYKGGTVKSYVNPSILAAVSSGCKDKQTAFNFVKILLSKNIQKHFDGFNAKNFPYSMPVNIAAYEEDKIRYSSEKAKDDFPKSFKVFPLPSTVTDEIDSLVKSGELSPDYDYNIWSVIEEEAAAYVEGKKSAKEAAGQIDRKVTLMLNE